MSDTNYLPDGLRFIFKTSPYHFFPIQLKVLEKIRRETNKNDDSVAVNILTITSCTAFLESILFESLTAVVSAKRNEASDELIKNLLLKVERNISSATFKDFEAISQDILGFSLNKFIKNETWEAIKMLFSLRNQAVHGKVLSIEYAYKENSAIGIYGKNYEPIIKYLLKMKLISYKDVNMSTIFGDEVTYFFIKNTKECFIDLTKNISNKFSTDTYKAFAHLRNDF